ncbi:hypothetical protein FHS55_004442 [Angulomicrobium tetraedrale]|uniref:Uncharacterized protein n=1 Tax=Ancylobacter tetraedralis TaxID=217068 RepID=A0A839ZGT6_9HYPH|nr:hypothetical protein [Ancylobacter tetraedralis]
MATRRAAKQVFYRLADIGVAQCVRSIEAQFGAGDATILTPSTAPPVVEPAAAPRPRNRSAAQFARIMRPGGPAA